MNLNSYVSDRQVEFNKKLLKTGFLVGCVIGVPLYLFVHYTSKDDRVQVFVINDRKGGYELYVREFMGQEMSEDETLLMLQTLITNV